MSGNKTKGSHTSQVMGYQGDPLQLHGVKIGGQKRFEEIKIIVTIQGFVGLAMPGQIWSENLEIRC